MTSLMILYLSLERLGLAADDERRAGLVDEDRVDLVDDGVVERALHVLERRELHVVAQVVEAELVVLAVGDVAPVGVRFSLSPCWLTTMPVDRPRKP
jgi:hypothetical protein